MSMKAMHIVLAVCGSFAIATHVLAADPAPAVKAGAKKADAGKAGAKAKGKKGSAKPAAGKAAKSSKPAAVPEKPMPVQAKGMGGTKGVAGSAEKAPLRFNPSGGAKAP
jgi:hypothetical protein